MTVPYLPSHMATQAHSPATTRDREQSTVMAAAMLAWLVIWLGIIAFLFGYGNAVSSIVV
ncbi:hypothetical protein [Haloparvum sedimenti]|uniref:hypothetical protein n=1 Tax=Haloparvum sedimenti TaxID=1678448 RepID=UPI00071E6A33|nr:hypothetical protein [Haloparvum sedimenti]